MSRTEVPNTTPATVREANTTDGGAAGTSVLLPLRDGAVSDRAVATARAIARGTGGSVLVVNAVTVPEQTSLDLPDRHLAAHRRETAAVVDAVETATGSCSATGCVSVGHRPSTIVANATRAHDVGTTVLDGAWTTARLSPLSRTPAEKLRSQGSCPVVVPIGPPLPDQASSLLVPVAGGPHSPVATRIAGAVASAHDAWIELLHVVTSDAPDRRDAADRYLAAARSRLVDTDCVDTWVLEADSVPAAIVEQSRYYEATVIGGPRRSRLRRFLFGSTARRIQRRVPGSLLTVWR